MSTANDLAIGILNAQVEGLKLRIRDLELLVKKLNERLSNLEKKSE